MTRHLALIGIAVSVALVGTYFLLLRANESPSESVQAKTIANVSPLGAPSRVLSPVSESDSNARHPTNFRSLKDLWGASDDLFEMYRLGINSKDYKLKYLAREAINICLPFTMKMPFPDAANRRDDGANAAELIRARTTLERSCRTFMSIPASELVRQRTEINLAIQNADFPVNPSAAELSRNPTEREVREAKEALASALNKLGPDGLLWLAPALGGWLEHVQTSSPGTLSSEFRDVSHIDKAVLLSQCALGYDCGPASVPYLFICSSSGTCPGSLEAYALNGLGPEQREVVRRQAQLIAKSIAGKDFSAFGL